VTGTGRVANFLTDTVFRYMNAIPQENVVVRPSEYQITAATTTFTFSATTSINDIRCPITMEEFNDGDALCQIRHCGHCFKETAIRFWFQRNVRCPVCRYDIRDYHEVDPSANLFEQPLTNVVDISGNDPPIFSRSNSPQPSQHSQLPYTRPSVNTLVETVSDSLTDILENYLDDSLQNNTIFSFEFPVMFYNDVSGGRNVHE